MPDVMLNFLSNKMYFIIKKGTRILATSRQLGAVYDEWI
jgi:hypothetical protein